MNGIRRSVYWWLRGASWLAAVTALVIAVSVIRGHYRQSALLKVDLQERNRLRLVSAKLQIEDYINEVWLCLRIMSANPDVERLSHASAAYLQTVYEANYDQHKIPEVYVIERSFDGTKRPFMAFERGDSENSQEELHALEREELEYEVQIEHLRRFAKDPALRFLISKPVELCVGEPGMVFSVPVWSEGSLVAIVAAMIPSSQISRVLERSSFQNVLVLANTDGVSFRCRDVPPEIGSWFEGGFARVGVQAFFEGQSKVFQAGPFPAIWDKVSVAGDQEWYISSVYPQTETKLLRAQGVPSALAVWGSVAVVILLGGAVVVLCGFIQALHATRSESEQRALALSESDARAQAVLDAAAEGIITIDERGIIESSNAAAERLFGYAADEIRGKNVSMLMPPPHDRRHDEYIARYSRTGEARMIGVGRELMGRRKDGSLIPIEAAVSEFRLKDRRFFTGVLRDLTERRRAERALRESEERFRAIADYTFAWENWISADGRVLWISPAVERITGYTVDECHTMRDYPLPLIQPDDRKRLAVLLETAHRERTSGDGERFRVRHKDGTPVWCSISWHPIFSADNEHVGYRSSIHDISARMRAEENARERLAELAHVGRVSLLNEMAAGLSHELSQPLAAIVNYAYACMEQIRSGKSTESGLMAILKCSADEAQRAGEIIEHMLKFGRKRTVRREHVDLNSLVRQAVELVSYEKGADGAQIECDLEPSLPPVLGDPVEIEQVLINLTRNSVEAVKENGAGTGSVVIQTSEKDDCLVECSIRDTGSGMTESQLKRMFEPFYTTKSNGVGLGLSISRSIVEDHGGRLWAAMNEPQGAILLMTLPTKKGEPSH